MLVFVCCCRVWSVQQRTFDADAAKRVAEARKAKRQEGQQQQQQQQEDGQEDGAADCCDAVRASGSRKRKREVTDVAMRKRRLRMSQGVGTRIPGLPEGDKALLMIIPASKQSSVYLECGGMTQTQLSGAVRGLNSTFSKPDWRLAEIVDGDFSNVLRYGRFRSCCLQKQDRSHACRHCQLACCLSTSAKRTIDQCDAVQQVARQKVAV
jgi:hypothetical protein